MKKQPKQNYASLMATLQRLADKIDRLEKLAIVEKTQVPVCPKIELKTVPRIPEHFYRKLSAEEDADQEWIVRVCTKIDKLMVNVNLSFPNITYLAVVDDSLDMDDPDDAVWDTSVDLETLRPFFDILNWHVAALPYPATNPVVFVYILA